MEKNYNTRTIYINKLESLYELEKFVENYKISNYFKKN